MNNANEMTTVEKQQGGERIDREINQYVKLLHEAQSRTDKYAEKDVQIYREVLAALEVRAYYYNG